MNTTHWYAASPRRFRREYIIVGVPQSAGDDMRDELYRWLCASLPVNGQVWEMDEEDVQANLDRLLRPYHRAATVARTARMLTERRWPGQLRAGGYTPMSDDWEYLDLASPLVPLEDDEIVGISEIAGLAKVAGPTVEKWTRRHEDFPAPRPNTVGGRRAWSWLAVAAWLDETGRTGTGEACTE